MDHVPWLSTAEWDGHVLTVERDVRESGTLAIPWSVPGHGEYVLTTASLMERKQPYDLPLELARHSVSTSLAGRELAARRISPLGAGAVSPR